MSLGIAVSGISIIQGNPKIDPGLFAAELSVIDKGPYELNRVQKISAITFIKALSDAGIILDEGNRKGIAIFLGNSYSIEEFKNNFSRSYKNTKPGLVNPSIFAFTTANSIASWLAVQFGARGINLTFTNGCVSSSQAIIAGCDSLISGKADMAIAGGVSLVCEDFKDKFYKCGFKYEFAGFLVLERKKSAIGAGRRPRITIEDFRQGFLSQANIEKLSNRKLPNELEDYRHYSDIKCVLTHLGNSLGENKFSYLNDSLGNAFSAAGVLGVSRVNKGNCVFFDVDSYGAYAALKINAE